MYSGKMKKKNNITIAKLNVGVFELRFSKTKLEIENNDKSWKMVFASHIAPYKVFSDMMLNDKKDAIETLCTGLYGTMSMCVNPVMLYDFFNLLKIESNKNGTLEKTF